MAKHEDPSKVEKAEEQIEATVQSEAHAEPERAEAPKTVKIPKVVDTPTEVTASSEPESTKKPFYRSDPDKKWGGGTPHVKKDPSRMRGDRVIPRFMTMEEAKEEIRSFLSGDTTVDGVRINQIVHRVADLLQTAGNADLSSAVRAIMMHPIGTQNFRKALSSVSKQL